jgi:hypothetical protein
MDGDVDDEWGYMADKDVWVMKDVNKVRLPRSKLSLCPYTAKVVAICCFGVQGEV